MIEVIGPLRPAIANLLGGRVACAGGRLVKVSKNITLKDLKWIRLTHDKKRKFKVKGKSGKDYIITLEHKRYICTCEKENCSHIKKVKEKINAS